VLENLITAFVDVVCDNVVLIIAGDPENPYGRELKRLALELGLSERVKFIGPVRGNIKESLYSNAEILVLPSHTENFGNVVIEALNRGLPVIASKGTPWQVLEDSKCGFWVENNPEDLSKTVTEFLNMDSKLKMIYRENAKKLVKDRFTAEVIWKEYLNMYNSSTTNVK
jgi:glycosyltransferase involved in cell wall biosynthesis